MGVRHPGFVLASLWNPVEKDGRPKGDAGKTVQTHLCLLPDQLGIFFRYAGLFVLTLILLSARAALIAFHVLPSAPLTPDDPILPTTHSASGAEAEKAATHQRSAAADDYTHSSHSSTSSTANGNLQVRTAQARTRTASPANGYGLPMPMPHQQSSTYSYPLVQHAGYYGDEDGKKDVKTYGSVSTKSRPRKKGFALFRHELKSSLGTVMVCGLSWYFWLIWHG
jgi:hypothetical protein